MQLARAGLQDLPEMPLPAHAATSLTIIGPTTEHSDWVLTPEALESYGWRIALLLGVSIVPFALMLRRTLPETQGCEEPDMPAMTDGPSFRQIVWLGSSLMAAGTVVTYFQSYMVTFGQRQLHLTTQASMAGQLVGNVMIIIAALIGGAASDKWGRKPVIVWPQLCLVLTIVPILTWLETAPSLGAFLAINIALGMFNNVTSAPLYATIAESLTAERRAKGFALIYSVPVTIFGGTTQLFITWLLEVTGSTIALGIYMTCIAALGLLAAVLLPESAPVRRGWKPAIA